jgi:hypothetical protein
VTSLARRSADLEGVAVRGAAKPGRHAAIFHFGPGLGARKSSSFKWTAVRASRVLMTTEALCMRRGASAHVKFSRCGTRIRRLLKDPSQPGASSNERV